MPRSKITAIESGAYFIFYFLYLCVSPVPNHSLTSQYGSNGKGMCCNSLREIKYINNYKYTYKTKKKKNANVKTSNHYGE